MGWHYSYCEDTHPGKFSECKRCNPQLEDAP